MESYFSRCASVAASVMSLTATTSMSFLVSAARRNILPIRPNPLIPTFIATARFLPLQFHSTISLKKRTLDKSRPHVQILRREGSRMQGEGEITLFNVKTTVVFTLSWAGVTPAPCERKMRDVVPVRTLLGVFP